MIGIIYSAFDQHVDQMNMERRPGDRVVVPSATVEIPNIPACFDAEDEVICEALFDNTNTYEGPFWDRLEPVLPANRTHTALSVGDRVFIDDRVFLCKSFGWEKIS
jgi:hypothetical protein